MIVFAEIQPKRLLAFGSFVLNVFLFTMIGWMGVVLILMFLLPNFASDGFSKIPQLVRSLFLVISAMPGLLFGIWFSKKMLDKQYWRLTDTELANGVFYRKKYPLALVERAIVGLPIGTLGKLFQKAKPGSVTGAAVDVLSVVDPRWNTVKSLYEERAKEENSLLLCFQDGSLLPLRLFLFPEGRILMEQLKERLKDRLVHNYSYSPEEIRRLRRRNVNELIPPQKIS